jgi:hypothetical protein
VDGATARGAGGGGGLRRPESRLVEKYVVIIECASETQQVEALRLCQEAGFQGRAVMS